MASPIDVKQSALYNDGMDIRNAYSFLPGVCILPLAEDPPQSESELRDYSPVVVLRMHAPYRVRRVAYNDTKDRNPPVIPSPQNDVGKFVFCGGTIDMDTNQDMDGVTFDWSVRADYLYVENCVSRNQDGLVLGTPPWLRLTSFENRQVIQPSTPQVGAISGAGVVPRVGKTMGDAVDFQNLIGYFYNEPSYFPGVFFSDNLINGGPTS